MIEVKGNYVFKFNLGDKKDFLPEEDFVEFVMVEQAGNVLPTFELHFASDDEHILKLLNEGTDLEVSYGKENDDLTDVKLMPIKVESGKTGNEKSTYSVAGLLSRVGYLTNPGMQIITAKSGIAALKTVVGAHFKTDFNSTSSFDTQNWVQHNVSDKIFANNLWLHSYNPTSFFMCGISVENGGTFVCKDLLLSLASIPLVRFTQNPLTAQDFAYDGDPAIISNTGFMNNWAGYGREKNVLDLDAGSEELVSEELRPLLALSSKLTRRADLEARQEANGIVNSNVHSNYWRAKLKNLQNLAVFSSVGIRLSVTNEWVPVRILDIINFKGTSPVGIMSSEYESGLYVVTKVARTIARRQVSTVVSFTRECFNSLKGDLK